MKASADPFAWLGLLKWSLAYSDGTSNSSDVHAMSEEDRAFLEAVMRDGIVNENERMKDILKQVTDQLDTWKNAKYSAQQDVDNMLDLLQELRDIVEQIDFARAFTAMKGLPFLLGCIQEETIPIPTSVKIMCLGLIATLCQHNPPVQKELLELGSLRVLCDLFNKFTMQPDKDTSGEMRARIMQAISANVRSYDMAEDLFFRLPQAPDLLLVGLGASMPAPPLIVRKRTLFFLRALVTSDAATRDRLERFHLCLHYVMDRIILLPDSDRFLTADVELVEMALALIQQILEQRIAVNTILSKKKELASVAVRRIADLRTRTGEDRADVEIELEAWERILSLLADAKPDNSVRAAMNE
jgi:hsp70-interacting protein